MHFFSSSGICMHRWMFVCLNVIIINQNSCLFGGQKMLAILALQFLLYALDKVRDWWGKKSTQHFTRNNHNKKRKLYLRWVLVSTGKKLLTTSDVASLVSLNLAVFYLRVCHNILKIELPLDIQVAQRNIMFCKIGQK